MPMQIILAGMSLLGTLAGTFGGIYVSGRLTQYRLEQLERKVQEHNNLVARTYQLEEHFLLLDEKIKVANHRLHDLEGA